MGLFTGGAGDNAFGADEHHGVDGGSNALRKLGLGDKSAAREEHQGKLQENYQKAQMRPFIRLRMVCQVLQCVYHYYFRKVLTKVG